MPYFAFVDTNAVLVRKNRYAFRVHKKPQIKVICGFLFIV